MTVLTSKVGLETENSILKSNMENMVSRSQLEEMEALFADTVNRLASRVGSLESSTSSITQRYCYWFSLAVSNFIIEIRNLLK